MLKGRCSCSAILKAKAYKVMAKMEEALCSQFNDAPGQVRSLSVVCRSQRGHSSPAWSMAAPNNAANRATARIVLDMMICIENKRFVLQALSVCLAAFTAHRQQLCRAITLTARVHGS